MTRPAVRVLPAAVIAQAAVVVPVVIAPVGPTTLAPIAAPAIARTVAVTVAKVIRRVEMNAWPTAVPAIFAILLVAAIPALMAVPAIFAIPLVPTIPTLAAITAIPLVTPVSAAALPPSTPTPAPASATPLAHFAQILQGEPVSLLPERDGLFWCNSHACGHRTTCSVDDQADHESKGDT